MNTNPIVEAEKIFQLFAKGRSVEREAAQNRLVTGEGTISSPSQKSHFKGA